VAQYLLESAGVVAAAAAVGLAMGWMLFRRHAVGGPQPSAAAPPDDDLAAQLADCRARATRLVEDMGLLRRELAGRDLEIARLVEERDGARAAKGRAQVDLANRTAELIVLGEEFARFRQSARGHGSTPHDDGEVPRSVP
jgi:hypothetical protein